MLAEHTTSASHHARPLSCDGLVELAQGLALCQRFVGTLLAADLHPWGLGYTELIVLWMCERAAVRGVGQKELVSAAGVSAAQMSGVVERLRQRGWLTAERGRQDRRQQLWCLAPEGQRVMGAVRMALTPVAEQVSERLSPADTDRLRELLQRLQSSAALPSLLGLFTPEASVEHDVPVREGVSS